MDAQPFTPPNTPAPPPARLTGTGAVPTFVSVTDCDGAVAHVLTSPKSRCVGDTSTGSTPVPENSNENATPFTDKVAVPAAGPVVVGLNA